MGVYEGIWPFASQVQDCLRTLDGRPTYVYHKKVIFLSVLFLERCSWDSDYLCSLLFFSSPSQWHFSVLFLFFCNKCCWLPLFIPLPWASIHCPNLFSTLMLFPNTGKVIILLLSSSVATCLLDLGQCNPPNIETDVDMVVL